MTSTAQRPVKSLPAIPSDTAEARVFCLPYSGTGASVYREWPRERNGIEFCPLQPPGRENRMREATYRSYTELARGFARDVEPWLDRPYALFGHCSSALAAYETAVVFQELGLPSPTRLYVSSQVAPQDGPVGRFLSFSDAQLAARLQQLIEQTGNTPVPGLLDVYVAIMRADVEVQREYVVPHPVRLTCPITAIEWTDDDEIIAGHMGGWPLCGETTYARLQGAAGRYAEGPADLLDVLEAGLTGD